jgi:hypothetical protein
MIEPELITTTDPNVWGVEFASAVREGDVAETTRWFDAYRTALRSEAATVPASEAVPSLAETPIDGLRTDDPEGLAASRSVTVENGREIVTLVGPDPGAPTEANPANAQLGEDVA